VAGAPFARSHKPSQRSSSSRNSICDKTRVFPPTARRTMNDNSANARANMMAIMGTKHRIPISPIEGLYLPPHLQLPADSLHSCILHAGGRVACRTSEWWCDRGLPTRTHETGSLLAITGSHAIVKKRMSRSPDCWDGRAAMTYCYWMARRIGRPADGILLYSCDIGVYVVGGCLSKPAGLQDVYSTAR
jgi:hypothetical protein